MSEKSDKGSKPRNSAPRGSATARSGGKKQNRSKGQGAPGDAPMQPAGNGGNGNGPEAAFADSPRSGRWLKIGLVLSLMLNALFIGAIGMRMYHVKSSGGGHLAGIGQGTRMFFRELPRERRRELRQTFRGVRSAAHLERRKVVAATRNTIAVLEADSYNRASMEEALVSLRAAREGSARQHDKFLLSVIDSLTPEERKLMASTMSRRVDRRAERRRRMMERRRNRNNNN